MSELLNEHLKILKKDRHLLKLVVNKLFVFGDLMKSLKDVDSSTGNINCPFHEAEGYGENTSQSAKVYYNEELNINTITCFTRKRSYTCFNFIEMVLEVNPYEYLIANKDMSKVLEIVDAVTKGYINFNNEILENRTIYVDNLFEEVDCDIVDYIERLYVDK